MVGDVAPMAGAIWNGPDAAAGIGEYRRAVERLHLHAELVLRTGPTDRRYGRPDRVRAAHVRRRQLRPDRGRDAAVRAVAGQQPDAQIPASGGVYPRRL